MLVFQEGVGADLFGFQQTDTIEAWVPLFLFSVLFGLSMDYQVFLLSRIRERHVQTGDTTDAVTFGVGSTARIITGAALIIVAVFSGFARGDLIMFQQMGFGVAVALLIDATVIRSVLLPSAMKLLGEWNWYLPALARVAAAGRGRGTSSGRAWPGSARLTGKESAMSETSDLPQPDPAMRRLDRLVGRWSMEGNLIGSDETTIRGETSFRWLPGGFFLEQRVQIDFGGPTDRQPGGDRLRPRDADVSLDRVLQLLVRALPYRWDVQGDTVTISVSYGPLDSTFTGSWREDGTFSGGWRPNPGADETVNVPYDIGGRRLE